MLLLFILPWNVLVVFIVVIFDYCPVIFNINPPKGLQNSGVTRLGSSGPNVCILSSVKLYYRTQLLLGPDGGVMMILLALCSV